ncbi:DNA polymerase II [Alteromonas aestuariivivens]|uniref:DNA polymerase n=1 Tax=Alteromonas aestuariivivens TaxID=1938339 RepID=A0A3D8MDH1_9ALTE|nr:DNA polymerase II [Alteromonas aestuariivivens]RDV28899.1 DNA polymerase II [Alteromonas aestuariivivens]
MQVENGDGFLLTRRTLRLGNRDHVELWVATIRGPVKLMSAAQNPVCFSPTHQHQKVRQLISQHRLSVSLEDTSLKTLEQIPLVMLRARNESEQFRLRRLADEHGLSLYEADVKLQDRFLMERFAYGSLSYQAEIPDASGTRLNAKVKGNTFLPQLRALSFDIECDEHERLFSIAVAGPNCNRVMIVDIGQPFLSDGLRPDYERIRVTTEKQLLEEFQQTLTQADPDILLGWNVKQFDLAVLERAAKRLGMPLNIGREHSPLSVREWENGQTIVEVPGRCVIDGIEALKTMTYHFESFSLDNVASQLLGKNKLIVDEDKLGTIKTFYQESPDELADYNFQDCVLVNEIAAATRMIDFLVLRSTLTGLDMSRPGGSVAAFLNVYLPKLHRAGYVSGLRPQDGGLASPGGYVMNSVPGLYRHVLVLDFKSLYPSIIRTFKIDPMGLAEGLLQPESAIPGFKGAFFSRNKHFLPDIIANLWAQRDEAKRQQDAPRSHAIKILMNSFYGVLGSGGCPFYDPRLASSITLRGHQIMQTTAQWITELGYRVIYGDTDSTFVHLEGVSEDGHAIEIGKQLESAINQRWRAKLKEELALDCFLEIEFETHFKQFFMPTIRGSEQGSKKRYAGLISKNGQDELIFKGLENVRSDWTDVAKDFQKTLYRKVFLGEKVEECVRDTVLSIRSGQLDNRLVYSKRLRKPLQHYTKSVPPHVRAARLAQQQSGTARYQNRTVVKYVITTQGPQTTECQTHPLDYEHYIEKQIRPIADSILPFIDLSFDALANEQLGLF